MPVEKMVKRVVAQEVKCTICDKSFWNHKAMTNHRRWHSELEYKEFQSKYIASKKKWWKNADRNCWKGINLGEKNAMWKGDNVGYSAIHDWVRWHLKKTEYCQYCNKEKSYDLANISGKYLRDLSDWEWLCRRCHMIKDGRMNNLISMQKEVSSKQVGKKYSEERVSKQREGLRKYWSNRKQKEACY